MLDQNKVLETAAAMLAKHGSPEPVTPFVAPEPVTPFVAPEPTHAGILDVTERHSGASWFTMKFKRRTDAEAYGEKREVEGSRFSYTLDSSCETLEKTLEDATTRELCKIPGFLKR